MNKLLFGFPSINIPEESDYVFWSLSGRHFGSEGLTHGKFEDIKESGFGIDAGPIMICHKNGKDVVILSSFSTRSFQKLRNSFSGMEQWYDYHSSTMEQSTRVTNDSIQFGFGESFRNLDQLEEAQETADCKDGICNLKDSFKSVKSEAIIGDLFIGSLVSFTYQYLSGFGQRGTSCHREIWKNGRNFW